MQARTFIVARAIVSTSLLGLAAPAHALCDAYSGTYATPPPGGGDGERIDSGTDQPGSGVETPRPYQEGTPGSLAGGAALVVAGRRRDETA
jgi:hypothetical protein